jgi:hypothetical protein
MNMKTKLKQPDVKQVMGESETRGRLANRAQTAGPPVNSELRKQEAFLEEARKECKRELLADHIETIRTLRDAKRFTFRAIAEWLNKRGIETDHSAVYRTYLAAIPASQRNPSDDWSDVDEPGYGDEPAK